MVLPPNAWLQSAPDDGNHKTGWRWQWWSQWWWWWWQFWSRWNWQCWWYQFSYMFPGNLYFAGCQALLLTTGNINFLFLQGLFSFCKTFFFLKKCNEEPKLKIYRMFLKTFHHLRRVWIYVHILRGTIWGLGRPPLPMWYCNKLGWPQIRGHALWCLRDADNSHESKVFVLAIIIWRCLEEGGWRYAVTFIFLFYMHGGRQKSGRHGVRHAHCSRSVIKY